MLALVEDTARDTVEVMGMATVWGATMDHTAITANMEIQVSMVDTVVAATAPAGTKKQSSAARRNTFIQFLSLSFVGEELSFYTRRPYFFSTSSMT